MNSKERVLIALDHKEPDRLPMVSSFTPEFAQKLEKQMEIEGKIFNPHGGVDHDLERMVRNDILLTAQGFANSYYRSLDHGYTCEWGIKWKTVEYATKFGKGVYTEIEENPLSDIEELENYIPPDPYIEDRYLPSKELVKKYGNEYAIMGVIVCTIFESAWALRGLDNLMMDFLINEDIANQLLDIPFNYHLVAGKKLVESGVDIIWTGDDVGGQNQMMISPELWRKFLKPRMAKLFSELKKINTDIKIAYHSDGYIFPIIDDLIDIGLDILNPIQPKSMDPNYLKKRYGDKLSLWGTIDIQETLPKGSIEDVKKETIERIKNLAPGGGFIIGPTHHIQIDTPLDNFKTMRDTVIEYGKYPINI